MTTIHDEDKQTTGTDAEKATETNAAPTNGKQPHTETSFAETAMRLGGKTDEEATRTGKVDRADDEVEALFAPQYKTINSPIHRAVWENEVPIELFTTPRLVPNAKRQKAMDKCLAVLRKHVEA